MQIETVATHNDSYVYIYKSNRKGELVSADPILEQCYLQSFSVTGKRDTQLRERSGRKKRELIETGSWDDYTCEMKDLYLPKHMEKSMSEVFVGKIWVSIKFVLLDNATFQPVSERWMRSCKAASFDHSSSDNDLIYSSSSFIGTDYS